MSSDGFDDENWSAPQRDERGRFRKGSSGNPDGRPRKRPERPKSLVKCLAEGLNKKVPVKANGIEQDLTIRELLAEKLLRAALDAKPKDMLHIAERLEHLTQPMAAEDDLDEEIFTEEDRRLLAFVERELSGEAPLEGADCPPRPQFTFD